MSAGEEIIRIAAKGDGVTASGAHHKGAVTGDIILSSGAIERGPHFQEPPCQHFATCGGCTLQNADDDALTRFVTERVLFAANSQSIEPAELLPTHLSPPQSRRRATLHAMRTQKGAVLGFKASGSHKIVNLAECQILRPELFAMAAPLRQLIAQHGGKRPVDINLTLTDQGVDCSIKHFEMEGLEATEAVLAFAEAQRLARLSLDLGYGAEAMREPEPLTITLSGVPVSFPSGAFLQATRDAEAMMVADAKTMLGGAQSVADLFSGLGTFAFALGDEAQVSAFEAAREPYLACKSAAGRSQRRVDAVHRDLFRNPVQSAELAKFDAALLDPPRAGAREQVAAIAESGLERVVYVSCNPASWARDAARLAEAGFSLQKLRPIGQFRWSTHVELVSYFTR